MRRLRTIRARRHDERGVTLVEMMLTMLIMSIVLVIAFDFLDRASILTFRAEAHGRAESETQLALRIVTEHTRGAFPIGDPCTTGMDTATTEVQGAIPAGYNNCLRFTVQRTNVGLDACAKTDFVYALIPKGDANVLVENRREHTGTTSACVTGNWMPRRVLLENVVNDATTQPLFTYYGDDGTRINPSDTAAVKKATSVKVTLATRFRKAATPLVMTSSASLRNNVTR